MAASAGAVLRAGGRRFPIGSKPRTIALPLPRRPLTGAVRVPLFVTSSEATGRIRQTLWLARA